VPKVSKETASQVQEFGPVTDRREEMDGYTVEFVSFAADSNLDAPLQALPGGMCQCPHWGYVIAERMWMPGPSYFNSARPASWRRPSAPWPSG
jgi:hypothetical protein